MQLERLVHGVALCMLLLSGASALAKAGMSDRAEGPDDESFVVGDEARAVIRAAFNEGIERGLVAGGSLLVIERGHTVINESFGFADLETQRRFGKDEIVTLASVSKPFTSTVLMRLVQAGHLELDVPISRYLPEAAALRVRGTDARVVPPTLRQLLSHTAGFRALAAGNEWQGLVYGPDTMRGATAAIIEAGLEYEPGSEYAYTQLGYVLAAHAAERVLNQPFEQICREWLHDPLGIDAATFHPSREVLSRMPTRYDLRDGMLQPTQRRRYRAVGEPIDPAASLAATPLDVAKLFQLHLGRGVMGGLTLLGDSFITEMHRPQPGTPGYGLGLNVNVDPATGRATSVRHGGATGTLAWADFEHGIVGVLFTQTRWRTTPDWRALIYDALETAGLGAAARAQRESAPE